MIRTGISELWRAYLEPQAVASGVPGHIVAFLGRRMLSNDPDGLVLMARHMLTAPDRTAELARLDQIPMLVIYGENDNSWSPAAQENMARRLGARRLCIPAAVHSPAVEAPATTAGALTQFWDAAEAALAETRVGQAGHGHANRLRFRTQVNIVARSRPLGLAATMEYWPGGTGRANGAREARDGLTGRGRHGTG